MNKLDPLEVEVRCAECVAKLWNDYAGNYRGAKGGDVHFVPCPTKEQCAEREREIRAARRYGTCL